jgi:hypothetical protein
MAIKFVPFFAKKRNKRKKKNKNPEIESADFTNLQELRTEIRIEVSLFKFRICSKMGSQIDTFS